MENGLKALAMAGSTLIAVILFAAVVYFFGNIGNVPTEQDQQLSTEQLSKFNLEYEIYDKSAMYGVDVISCLNKAVSNNEKYIEGKGFLAGNRYGEEFLVDVTIEITSELTESIEVKAFNSALKETTVYLPSSNPNQKIIPNITLEEAGFDIKGLTGFNKTDIFGYKMEGNDDSLQKDTPYSLVYGTAEEKQKLKDLLAHSANPRQVIKNKAIDEAKKNPFYIEAENKYGWSSAIWTTYLYDFKKKRFECTDMEYSADTGRISRIYFKEIAI